jgi:hypothetical protein
MSDLGLGEVSLLLRKLNQPNRRCRVIGDAFLVRFDDARLPWPTTLREGASFGFRHLNSGFE